MKEFQVGDEVLIDVDGQKVRGVVESIQLAKGLVDVKIYEPGNRNHCLIRARKPEEVFPRAAEAEPEESENQPRKHGKAHSA